MEIHLDLESEDIDLDEVIKAVQEKEKASLAEARGGKLFFKPPIQTLNIDWTDNSEIFN